MVDNIKSDGPLTKSQEFVLGEVTIDEHTSLTIKFLQLHRALHGLSTLCACATHFLFRLFPLQQVVSISVIDVLILFL